MSARPWPSPNRLTQSRKANNSGALRRPFRLCSCCNLVADADNHANPNFQRILLKISGEALAARQGFGVDTARIHEVAAELADVHSLGIQIAIVVGGGNFFRGVADQAKDMDRVSADHMGMLATVINALALQDALEKQHVYTRVQSAIEMNQVAEPFIRHRARSGISKKAAWSYSPAAPVIPTFRRILQLHCALWKSRPTSSSRPPKSMASTVPTP